jgi:HEAT repeat protein
VKALQAPIRFIWLDSMDILAKLFEDETRETRGTVEKIVKLLGPYGVSLLVYILMESRNKFVRKSAVEMLVGMGDYGRIAMIKILRTPSNHWYIYRNALAALVRLGKPEDAPLIDGFLLHENPRVREEAIAVAGALEGASAEPKLLRALSDPDLGVRKRAAASMGQSALKSPRVVTALSELLFIDEERHPEHRRDILELKVEAINALSLIGNESVFGDRTVEELLIGLMMPEKKWSQKLMEKIKQSAIKREGNQIIQAAVLKALWRMGTKQALPPLLELEEKVDKSMVTRVKETIRQIQMREQGPARRGPA